jgi:hypothetical protein
VEQEGGVLGRGARERWGKDDEVEGREGAGKRLRLLDVALVLLILCFALRGVAMGFALLMQREIEQ